ncbi:3-keto-5-aminohexanoate cleavage protein [Bacillus horti]|uniref:3-keto-5-aminohexanoate cleavage enzyme n=1 Tax=Caldalkalibacillus horti TaxID=77523 RepID=A0ABT9VVV5_9BACI|nr:3-keto-5-aminohexanoate cleavage protein [Bacillus horti]MDQ0165128.1 3-keto-5-aminohexanoate cleavage enzyme [Bacillus horti]
MEPCIVTVAVNGAEVMREQNPAIPYTPEEIANEVEQAYEAGASIAHIHARRDDGSPTQDLEYYDQIVSTIRRRCDIIIQVSTGGAIGMSIDERKQPIQLKPEMATLTTGTVNFGSGVFQNSLADMEQLALYMQQEGVRPEFEIFEAGMIHNALQLVEKGYVQGHQHYDFVLGVPGALPASLANLLFLVQKIPSNATWTVAGIGRHQLFLAVHALLLGGHVRVGFEDNIYYTKGVLAQSNAQLVKRVVRIAKEVGREIATVETARRLLHIV